VTLRPMLEHPAMWDGRERGGGASGGLDVAGDSGRADKVPLADYLPSLLVGPVLWRL
jgi:hypothetical protein